jgi:hypothetical protein
MSAAEITLIFGIPERDTAPLKSDFIAGAGIG